MPNQITLAYTIPLVGTVSVTQLQTAVTAVVLNTSIYEGLGVSLVSDATAPGGGGVVRTLVFTLVPQFNVDNYTADSGVGYQHGSIVSSSANDTDGGTGLRKVRVIAEIIDPDLVQPIPVEADVILNGTTPVRMPWTLDTNFPMITRPPTFVEVGSLGTNDGQIQIFSNDAGLASADNKLVITLPKNFQGSVLSTSAEDNATGIGTRQVQFTYMDAAGGGPHTETVILNGQTPVNLTNLNHSRFVTVNPAFIVGSNGMNEGIITFFSGLNGTGCPVAQVPQAYYAYFPLTTDRLAAFRDLYTHTLAEALTSHVVAADPVVT